MIWYNAKYIKLKRCYVPRIWLIKNKTNESSISHRTWRELRNTMAWLREWLDALGPGQSICFVRLSGPPAPFIHIPKQPQPKSMDLCESIQERSLWFWEIYLQLARKTSYVAFCCCCCCSGGHVRSLPQDLMDTKHMLYHWAMPSSLITDIK